MALRKIQARLRSPRWVVPAMAPFPSARWMIGLVALALAGLPAQASDYFLAQTVWDTTGYTTTGNGIGVYDWDDPDDACYFWATAPSTGPAGAPVRDYYSQARIYPAAGATVQTMTAGPLFPIPAPLDDCMDMYPDPDQTYNVDGTGSAAGSSVWAEHQMDPAVIADASTVRTLIGYCSAAVATTERAPFWGIDLQPLFNVHAFGGQDVVGDSGAGRSDGCSSHGRYDLAACPTFTYSASPGSLKADQPILLEGGPASPMQACNRHVGAPGLGTNYVAEHCVEADLLDTILGTWHLDVRDGDHLLVYSAPLTPAEADFATAHDLTPSPYYEFFIHGSSMTPNHDTGQCDP